MVVGVPSNSLSGIFISLCRVKPIIESPSAWLSSILARESKNRRWPTDPEFREAWLTTPIYGSRACQVVLECLEAQFGHHETVDLSESSVEHILPQTLSPEWERLLGDEAANTQSKWLHTIGNLTLTGYNPELSNNIYSEKRKILALSHFELNRFFASCETWGAPEILGRAESLFAKAQAIWPRPSIAPEEEPAPSRPGPASFHADCIRYAQTQLGVVFSKLSQTRYEAGEQRTRLVCAVSAEHKETGSNAYFWFRIDRSQLDFLEGVPSGWLCFGCGSAEQMLLVPTAMIVPLLVQMSETTSDTRRYWHLVVQKKNGKLVVRLLGGTDGPDLTEFLLSDRGAFVAVSSKDSHQ